jgi:hypothetical protein
MSRRRGKWGGDCTGRGLTWRGRGMQRLMCELGIAPAAARKKRPRTTVPAPAGPEQPSDLLERDFSAPAPNRRRVTGRLGGISALRSVGP